jgi:hypothetical protein
MSRVEVMSGPERARIEESDHRQCQLLCARRERQCRRAAENRDEVAPPDAEHGSL